MSFSKYAALVKNLRGVALFNLEEESVESSIQWLVKRFRYRNLGITPSLVLKYRSRLAKYLGGNPFKELVSPVPEVARLVELVKSITGVPLEVAEALVYSSVYISPCLLVGDYYSSFIEKLSTSTVYVCKNMNTSVWKLHLRIADYTVLDFYEECVDEVLRALESGKNDELKKIVESRETRIEKDKKRYWRIICNNGKPFLHYIDLLNVVVRHGTIDLKPDYSAGLAIVPVVRIPGKLE